MKKKRLSTYMDVQDLLVIEQLAAMSSLSLSAYTAKVMTEIAKNNGENRALRVLLPELKNELRRGINSAMAQQRRYLVRTAVEATVARAMVVHLTGLKIGAEASFDLSEQAFEIAERSMKKPLEGFEKSTEVLDRAEADSVGDPGEDDPNRSGLSNTKGTRKEKF
jgi:hypothetical protein